MKKYTMLLGIAAMMVAAPMFVSAHCGSCDAKAKKESVCTKKGCEKDCKCKKAACTKKSCEDGCKCKKASAAKKCCGTAGKSCKTK